MQITDKKTKVIEREKFVFVGCYGTRGLGDGI